MCRIDVERGSETFVALLLSVVELCQETYRGAVPPHPPSRSRVKAAVILQYDWGQIAPSVIGLAGHPKWATYPSGPADPGQPHHSTMASASSPYPPPTPARRYTEMFCRPISRYRGRGIYLIPGPHMRNFIYKGGCRCNPWLAKCNPKVFKCNPKPKPLLIWWKHQNHPTTCCIKEDQLKHYITVYKTMNNAKITQFVCQYSMVDGYWIANVQCQLQV